MCSLKYVSFSPSIMSDSPELTDPVFRALAEERAPLLLDVWLKTRQAEIDKINKLFDENSVPHSVSATTFSDLYKVTMEPSMRCLEALKGGNITVTFGIDLRDEGMRAALRQDHATKNRVLINKIHAELTDLEERKFDPEVFSEVLTGPRANIFEPGTVEAICFEDGKIRTLVDAGGVKDYGVKHVRTPADKNKITICFYYDPNAEYAPEQRNDDGSLKKAAEKGVHFIEATGPWHRVTWLETSLMQCVYEAKLRHDLDTASPRILYKDWLRGALLRCAKSVAYTQLLQEKNPGFKPALFTGRRTGGLLFLMLQNMFFADHFKQFLPPAAGGSVVVRNSIASPTATDALGTSSVDCWFLLRKMGLPCLNPVGTHAHELSMVTSVLFAKLDQNKFSVPVTQAIGHYLYYELVWKKTGGPMPMLPDTLGTRAFMKAANLITIEIDGVQHKLIDLIQSARQDSGKLPDFKDNMREFGYVGGMMASEIDSTKALINAFKLGYGTFGAGGFFGDSEKVWGNPEAKSNSMAVKAVRVEYTDSSLTSYWGIPYMKRSWLNWYKITGYPIKIGDPEERLSATLKEGKLSLDKNLPKQVLNAIKAWAANVRAKAVDSRLISADGQLAPETGIPLSTLFTKETGLVRPMSCLEKIRQFFS